MGKQLCLTGVTPPSREKVQREKGAGMEKCAWIAASASAVVDAPQNVARRCFELIGPAGLGARYAGVLTCVVMAALLINCVVLQRSSAQIQALQQPQFSLMDENDVDLLSANAYLHETDA